MTNQGAPAAPNQGGGREAALEAEVTALKAQLAAKQVKALSHAMRKPSSFLGGDDPDALLSRTSCRAIWEPCRSRWRQLLGGSCICGCSQGDGCHVVP